MLRGCILSRSQLTDTDTHADKCVLASSGPCNKANIFLGVIEYELNSLLGASHLVDYISVHIRFDLERYLPSIISCPMAITVLYFRHTVSICLSSHVKFLFQESAKEILLMGKTIQAVCHRQ